MWWVVASLLFLSGCALVALGLRGRRIGHHPVCRRCGFDLFGRPEGSLRCAECGATLTNPGAVRVGHRQRKPRFIFAGTVLLLVTAACVPSLVWMRNFDWNQYKPVWWLMWETRAGAKRPTRLAAVLELVRRYDAKALSTGTADRLVTSLLDAQADASMPWQMAWGDLIEGRRFNGKLSDAEWQRYWRQALDWHLATRPRVTRGKALPAAISFGQRPARAGAGSANNRLSFRAAKIQIDGAPCPDVDLKDWTKSAWTDGRSFPQTISLRQSLDRLRDGPHRISCTLEATVFDPRAAGAEVARFRVDLDAPWELLPADQPSTYLVVPEERRMAVHAAVNVLEVSRGPAPAEVRFSVVIMRPPMHLAQDAYLRIDGKEWKVGSIFCPAWEGGVWNFRAYTDETAAERADVIFRPNPWLAEDTLDFLEIWGEQILVKYRPIVPRLRRAKTAEGSEPQPGPSPTPHPPPPPARSPPAPARTTNRSAD